MRFIAVLLSIAIMAIGIPMTVAKDRKETADENKFLKKQAIVICSQKHHISRDAIKDIINHVQVSDDHEVKCWLSCVLKKLGMMKNSKIDWEHCKYFRKVGLNAEEKAKADKIAEICQAEVPQDVKDDCQLAYSAAFCKIKYWNKFGLPQGTWKQ